MYNYHPKFCYGTHTTHGQKVYFLYPFLKYFPPIPRFQLIRIYRVLEYSVYSAFQNIQYFPCFRIFRIFAVYTVFQDILCVPPFRSTIQPNRVTRLTVTGNTCQCRSFRQRVSSPTCQFANDQFTNFEVGQPTSNVIAR